jgi:hypothetical protein
MFYLQKRGLQVSGFIGIDNWDEVLVQKLNKPRSGDDSEVVILVRNMVYLEALARRCHYPEGISVRIYDGEFGQHAVKALKYVQRFFVRRNYSPILDEPRASGWEELYRVPKKYCDSVKNFGDLHWLPLAILKAATEGQISRIRECRFCQKWFLAKRVRQAYCSAGCRQQAFRATPEGKRKRAAYMRAYRLNHPNAR